MNQIEVEIKSLLGSEETAKALKRKIQAPPFAAELKAQSKQLNHYFICADTTRLSAELEAYFTHEERAKLWHILKEGKSHSIRTRSYEDGSPALLVIKASLGDDTSSNGVTRIEFEHRVGALTLDALDQLLLAAGCVYQAKWSREREEYTLSDGTVVCLDKNAGYGYLAEFERVVSSAAAAEDARQDIQKIMSRLDISELPQDRLERMFAFYNEHWPEYYGTDKIFTLA